MTGLCGKRERERARVQQPKDGEGKRGKGKRGNEKWKEKNTYKYLQYSRKIQLEKLESSRFFSDVNAERR